MKGIGPHAYRSHYTAYPNDSSNHHDLWWLPLLMFAPALILMIILAVLL